jgi:hypothetical protein
MEAISNALASDEKRQAKTPPSLRPLPTRQRELSGAYDDHRRRLFYILGNVGAVGVISLVILFWFDPTRHSFYPVCALHRTTGLLCPGCGSLRAMHQLLHGNLAAALHFNVLLISSLPVWVWLSARFCVLKLKNQPATINIRPLWLWAGLILVVAFGILRNLPFGQLAWLAPAS